VAELKRLLKSGIEELIAEHRTLEKNLVDTRRGLQVMAEDRRQMEKALNHARKHSLTDELTGLPNRSAFVRQLKAEIGRARRYGFSLALALIDLDDLKTINERHGYAAGDAILHTYAREIMSQFRGYDLVARYAEDEFAVLLPNTQKDGAVRAIDKAQKHAAGTFIQFNGQNLPLPTFSSVLTLYSHGEQPEALLQRVDDALSHAKQRGRAQSVVALAAN
jgi:diguanylate cyclase (GGDEF)-like protein